MRLTLLFFLLFSLCSAYPAAARDNGQAASAEDGNDIALYYLEQARVWRDAGRYELARQAYAQALSTCRSASDMEIIKRELNGVELLIRTMR